MFDCLCSDGCDKDTGECLDGGTCPQSLPKEHPYFGPGCNIGKYLAFTCCT